MRNIYITDIPDLYNGYCGFHGKGLKFFCNSISIDNVVRGRTTNVCVKRTIRNEIVTKYMKMARYLK